jgi:lipoprotein-anchoring transpeptidase ErfK/SrfK
MNGEGLTGTDALIALGITLAAAVAAVVLVTSGSSGDPPSLATTQPQPESQSSKAKPADGERQLRLATQGHPVLTVRDGEQVDIHSAPGGPVVRTVGDETEFGSPRMLSVAKTRGEWAGVPNPFTGNDSLGWIRLDPDQLRSGYTKASLVIDLSEYRAQVYRGDRAIRSFTVAIGAPGTETPTGEFAVTDTFRDNLNPAYGCCAVALTTEQPKIDSGWIGGNRIAIHGTSGPLGIPISHGCVRAADRDVDALVGTLPPGAPVTIQA